MALVCRSLPIPLQRVNTANFLSPNCLPKLRKFSLQPRYHIVSRVLLSSSSMENPPEGYRRNVGICLISPSKKIFAASRLDIPDSWQMPQGGVDESEDPRAAAIRELREETGVTSADIVAEVPYWLTYDFPPHVREKLKRQWGSDWKGQAQKWFLFRLLTGKDEEINLLGDGTEKPEFGEWSWMSPQQILDHAVDFKKPVYQEVFKIQPECAEAKANAKTPNKGGRRGLLILSTATAITLVSDSQTELLNKYLKKSQDNKAKNDKERLDSFYKRNYKDYFGLLEGDLRQKKDLPESEKAILDWLDTNK